MTGGTTAMDGAGAGAAGRAGAGERLVPPPRRSALAVLQVAAALAWIFTPWPMEVVAGATRRESLWPRLEIVGALVSLSAPALWCVAVLMLTGREHREDVAARRRVVEYAAVFAAASGALLWLESAGLRPALEPIAIAERAFWWLMEGPAGAAALAAVVLPMVALLRVGSATLGAISRLCDAAGDRESGTHAHNGRAGMAIVGSVGVLGAVVLPPGTAGLAVMLAVLLAMVMVARAAYRLDKALRPPRATRGGNG